MVYTWTVLVYVRVMKDGLELPATSGVIPSVRSVLKMMKTYALNALEIR